MRQSVLGITCRKWNGRQRGAEEHETEAEAVRGSATLGFALGAPEWHPRPPARLDILYIFVFMYFILKKPSKYRAIIIPLWLG